MLNILAANVVDNKKHELLGQTGSSLASGIFKPETVDSYEKDLIGSRHSID